jgi:hypothetical protein
MTDKYIASEGAAPPPKFAGKLSEKAWLDIVRPKVKAEFQVRQPKKKAPVGGWTPKTVKELAKKYGITA